MINEDFKILHDEDVKVTSKSPIEYTTHKEYAMQQEREANRKLKAEIGEKRKLKKGIGIKQQIDEYPYEIAHSTPEQFKKFFDSFEYTRYD